MDHVPVKQKKNKYNVTLNVKSQKRWSAHSA